MILSMILVGNCALLAPAAELGYTYSKNPLIGLSTITMPLLRLYKGPVYPTVLEPILHNLLTTACKIGFLRDTICFGQLVALLGPGVDQLDLVSLIYVVILEKCLLDDNIEPIRKNHKN